MASRYRGKARTKLHDLSRVPPELDDWIALTARERQHPIATAILGAGLVEHHVAALLRTRFKRRDDRTWAMLVGDDRCPLYSFNSKIVVGYALGIYDQGMRSDLDIVRKIRNAFAHSKRAIQFDHPAVVAELKKATRSALPKKYWKGTKARTCYVVLCSRLSGKLTQIGMRRWKSIAQRHGLKRVRAFPYFPGTAKLSGLNPFE
jgi:hypothetical protein